MPEWCPQCNAMLPDGLAECPRCGKQLRKPDEDPNKLGAEDIANITLTVLAIAAIPIGLIVLISLICVWSGSL